MLYTIEDKTLTALGDVIRNQEIGTNELPYLSGNVSVGCVGTQPFQFDNYVKKIKVKGSVSYNNSHTSNYVVLGILPRYEETLPYLQRDENCIVMDDDTELQGYDFEIIIEGNVITFGQYINDVGNSIYLDYELTGLDENGEEFKYTPLEMPSKFSGIINGYETEIETLTKNHETEINTLTQNYETEIDELVEHYESLPLIPDTALNITGNCDYKFSEGGWDWFIEQNGDKITTSNIKSASYMFQRSNVSSIPFVLNFDGNTTTNKHKISNMFNYCDNLTEIPTINYVRPQELGYLFQYCENLREIPEDFCDTWDWSYVDTLTSSYSAPKNHMFSQCSSLRKYPNSILSHGNPVATNSVSTYYNLFSSCRVLDEVINLPFPHYNASWTSNGLNNMVNTCDRLKEMTFALQEDGTPYVMKWKNQTLDLSKNVGYTSSEYVITGNNSGITRDKKVTDDATYQALKDDADWFSCDINYSRYNHTSAVNTINSLPDTSAYLATAGGTNTIKFKGASGALTDGGAINTLTEEEIAVAVSRGWTVSLV